MPWMAQPRGNDMKLLSFNSDAKTIKSNAAGTEYLTAILYLAPANSVPGINVCAMAELAGCIKACLYNAGRAAIFPAIHAARRKKTEFYRDDQKGFMLQLKKEVAAFQKKASKLGKLAAIRLNGTSDIPWENIPTDSGLSLMADFPDIQWYDYTKLPGRRVPSNYHLTASYSEANQAYASKVSKTAHNIAVVFRTKSLPETFLGRRVISGDSTDLRFLDEKNVVVGLYAKGTAKKDSSGFVVDYSRMIARG